MNMTQAIKNLKVTLNKLTPSIEVKKNDRMGIYKLGRIL
jgi:hypothetical protein